MGRPKQLLLAAAISLLATHVFFFEYRPGVHRVEVPYDLKDFHYPLADYAYQSLREGRIPQWDPSIYCGLPFVANVQAALFYPPSWALVAVSWGKDRLRYQALEDFAFLHVWAAFLLCFAWLRWRGIHWLAATLAATMYAASGHAMTHLQHLGMIAGHTWLPLGLWGIDQAHWEGGWRPLWKTTVASALCFLAGFTPLWTVFAVTMLAFALARAPRWRAILGTCGALIVSMLLCAVQLLPAWEASGFTLKTPRYIGHRNPLFYLSFSVPNYFNFGLDVPVSTNAGFDYYYLGCAGLIGLVGVLVDRSLKASAPALAVAGANLLFLADPFQILEPIINKPTVLSDLVRAWYFTAGLLAGLTLLAGIGLDAWIARRRQGSLWMSYGATAACLLWSVRLVWTWSPGGADFPTGWWSAVDTLIGAGIAAFALLTFTKSRPWVAVALTLMVVAEYKAFGTSKRFNAASVQQYLEFPNSPLPTMAPQLIAQMRQQPEYRIAIDNSAMFPQHLRHAYLTTPQGFDPFIPIEYRDLLRGYAKPLSDREFDLRISDSDLLSLLGVRYVITRQEQLSQNAEYELLQPSGTYHHVHEWKGAQPGYGWEIAGAKAEVIEWSAEHRGFKVSSQTGGRFRLSEQFFPGWSATLDGEPAPTIRCHRALQCIDLPPGEHKVEFRYRSTWLATGAAVSLVSAVSLCVALVVTRNSKRTTCSALTGLR